MKNLPDPKYFPYFVAVVQGVLFSLAGGHKFGPFGYLVGLGVGMAVSYSMALASTRFSEISDKRKPLARVAMIVLYALSPTTITLSFAMPGHVMSTIAWALCPDVAIGLAGAIAGKSLLPDKKPAKSARAKSEKVQNPLKPARAKFKCKYHDKGCKDARFTQEASNAHSAKCKFKLAVINTPFEKVEKVKTK